MREDYGCNRGAVDDMKRVIVTISLAVAILTIITSNQPSIYASPTTEDDGWAEGDYEGSSEEQEEQAQEDWEDAGRPGDDDNDDNNNFNPNNDNNDNSNSDNIPECKRDVHKNVN